MLHSFIRRHGLNRRQALTGRSVDRALRTILAQTPARRFRFLPYKNIRGVIVNNYCESAKCAVEVEYAGAAGHPMRRVEDADRSGYLNALGVKLIQFPEEIILQRPESVRNTLIEELGQ